MMRLTMMMMMSKVSFLAHPFFEENLLAWSEELLLFAYLILIAQRVPFTKKENRAKMQAWKCLELNIVMTKSRTFKNAYTFHTHNSDEYFMMIGNHDTNIHLMNL